MAEEQKPTVEVPEAAKPDTTTAADTAAAAAEDKPAEAPKPAEAAETEAAKTDDKDDSKPVDEGHLGHKAQGASFPKNLIPTKEFFFFGSDAVEPKVLTHYLKSEKSAETAHSNIAWASHTGKGLLFMGDKKAPTSVIHLADATEPEVDGSNKFHFTSKGNKHSFKAASAAERDGWVAQLKLKIAEAKELAATVTESETYKKTLDIFKPAVPAKEDKPAEDTAKAEEPAKADDAPKEGEAAKDDSKAAEEPKRRSASRKRASFFNFGVKKDEHKAEETAAGSEAAEPAAEAANAPAADAPAPVAEEEAAPAESSKEKAPAPTKRNSFFGAVFSKKEKKPAEAAKPAEDVAEAPKEGEAAATDAAAPVIPPVESTTPLNVDVPAAGSAENVEATGSNSEAKKEAKEKRKSSLPFAFGKRDKSPSPVDGEDKAGKSAFSKLRATIKGKAASKAEEKPVEESSKDETAAEGAAKETAGAEETKDAGAEAGKAAEPEADNKPENVASSAPAVTAAA